MEPIWLGFMTLLTAMIVAGGALWTSWLNGRQIRQGKEQDYARQDAVAAKAAEAAALLLKAQHDSIARTDEVARLAAEADERTMQRLAAIDKQGQIIHSLVNQKLTTVTEQALSATLALLPHLEEALARIQAAGLEPPAEDLKRLADTRKSIVDLRATLERRSENQAEADAEMKQSSGNS